MRIYNDPTQVPPVARQPQFKAIKSVSIEGLYNKPEYKELANDLVKTLKSNPNAMEFCKKYDVKIIFRAYKDFQESVTSAIHILFDNPAKKKTFGIFGSTRDNVSLHKLERSYDLTRSIRESTESLKASIMPETEGDFRTGMLNAHLKFKDEEMTAVKEAKAQKVRDKALKKEAETVEINRQKTEGQKLQDEIDDLIQNSK